MASESSLEGKLQNLTLSGSGSSQTGKVADSWEDSVDDISDNDQASPQPVLQPRSPVQREDFPAAPPPTPASPTQAANSFARSSLTNSRDIVTSPSRLAPEGTSPSSKGKRPETSTAAASRLIAAGLGIRPPKRTEEERKYDRAIKENEIRKKAQEKEQKRAEEEAKEKAKRDIWED